MRTKWQWSSSAELWLSCEASTAVAGGSPGRGSPGRGSTLIDSFAPCCSGETPSVFTFGVLAPADVFRGKGKHTLSQRGADI